MVRFLGKGVKDKVSTWMQQCLCFEFLDPAGRTCIPALPSLDVKKGGVFERVVDQGNHRVSERQVELDSLSSQLISRLFRELCSHQANSNFGYIPGIVHFLMVHLFYLRQHGLSSEGGLMPKQVAKIIIFMKGHLPAHLTLAMLARELKISPGYLCTRFKQSTGFTPFGYLNKLRMERALELLQNTELLVIQVALEVGIDNHAQFCRAFKKFHGISPSAVRKKED